MKLSIRGGVGALKRIGASCLRAGVVTCLTGMAWMPVHGFQSWNGKAGNQVFTDSGNWPKSPYFLDLSTSGSGEVGGVTFDAHLDLAMPSGVYTFAEDLLTSRLVASRSNRDVVLDLKGHTLTLLGKETAEAFYFRGDAPGSSVTFTNGLVVVPECSYKGYTLKYSYVNVTHNQNGLPTNVTLRIAGAGTVLKSPRTDLKYGANNCISVENGATLETALNLGGEPNSGNTVSEHLTLRLDGGTFKTTDGTEVFTVGNVKNSISNELVFANGGSLENMNMHMFTIGRVEGARFSRVILEGAATSLSITNRPQFPVHASATGSGYHVRKGACLTFTNTNGDTSLGRFWLAAGGEVVVTGEGSRLVTESSLPCNIGNSASGARLQISDHAAAFCGALTAGSSVNCNDNVIQVDTGASLAVATLNIGGQMQDSSGAYSTGNRVEILSGAGVVATNCYVGSRSFSKDNVLRVSGAGSSLTVLANLELGVTGGVENQLEVFTGATVSVCGRFYAKGAGSQIRLLGGALKASQSVFYAPAQIVFSRPADDSVVSFQVTAGDLTIPETVVLSIDPTTTYPASKDAKWTLFSCSGNLSVPERVMGGIQTSIPAGYRLKKTARELSVVRNTGTIICFR